MGSGLRAYCFMVLVTVLGGSTPRRLQCPAGPIDTQPLNRVDTSARVAALRREMTQVRSVRVPPLDAFIITPDDEHQSEYVAERDRRREFVSGFSGSHGDAVVTRREAALWTDGRYYLQADEQLDCHWLLMRRGQPGVPSIAQWLSQVLPPWARVGADPRLVPHVIWDAWTDHLARANISLISVGLNPIDLIWTNRPPYAKQPAFVHDLKYAGKEWGEKVLDLRQELKALQMDAMVVTSLDEVAWLLNIRGRDTPYSPLVRAFLIVTPSEIHMYTNQSKIPREVRLHLNTWSCHSENCVRLHYYENITGDLRTFSQGWSRVLIPSDYMYNQGASQAIYSAVSDEKRVPHPSPILFMKARKNPRERAGMRNAHVRDGAALCDFIAHMEDEMSRGEVWTEVEVAKTVDQFRREQLDSRGLSFATIAGFGPNGALPHYTPAVTTNRQIYTNSTLVLDSGGQYLDGTTDVTRTLHFGSPNQFERETYTRVLQGSIQLSALVFPQGVLMSDVDVLARAPLWQVGLDYRHGTGHGIGAFLDVHESPVNIIYKGGNKMFEEGYFFSDEPGYYHEGFFGVRLENILEVVNRTTTHSFDGPYLGFEPVTLVPYEPKLIDLNMLSNEQIQWLNDYNAKVIEKVGAELKLQRRMKGFHWLLSKTIYIPAHGATSGVEEENQQRPSIVMLVILVATAALQ